MSAFTTFAKESYDELLAIRKNQDVMNTWFLMPSIVPTLIIAASYLYFVLSLGPRWMKNRPAFELKPILIIYNAYQVVFSLWLFLQPALMDKGFVLMMNSCNTVFEREVELTVQSLGWWFFFSKIVDLLDTIFFVLRKKTTQITFLHVYHHTTVMVFSWIYLKLLPGQQGVAIGWLNALVHVVMYTYYLIAALGPAYRKYIWWKKYMTTLQLVQFGLMLVYLGFIILFDCKMPRLVTFFFTVNVSIFLYLFTDFYVKTYKSKPKKIQ